MADDNKTNVEKLKDAGIIPSEFKSLARDDEAAIESLTDEEIEAIISSSLKLHEKNKDFTKEYAKHGFLY
jgi:hypothetical protein